MPQCMSLIKHFPNFVIIELLSIKIYAIFCWCFVNVFCLRDRLHRQASSRSCNSRNQRIHIIFRSEFHLYFLLTGTTRMNTTAGLLQDPVSSFSNGHSNLISNQLSEAHNSAANVTTQSSATIYGKSGGLSTSNYVIAALYWSIFIFGCLGNSFVLLVTTWSYNGVGKKQAMFKFTCSLAISDLGLLLGVAWINALLSINPAWRFGDGMCKLYTIWRSLTSNTSIWILMAIAVDRY